MVEEEERGRGKVAHDLEAFAAAVCRCRGGEGRVRSD
jgi:hypothetical protein